MSVKSIDDFLIFFTTKILKKIYYYFFIQFARVVTAITFYKLCCIYFLFKTLLVFNSS
ncbi:hypothetical protein NBO_28g0038 [Nosema bombycis CQ1]|uniref:Uncharacterized protein n=1 Tax=Nosema bombycis (strain CQ1 / CVCC 102059) TaxID=578461 RepID=R0M8Y7_NOSB1|nr:hypothetical protein NBO_28g0038 [Nosema bombycis CQ1]|eukprot:EOB14399.1 hypothetical protein NBO_28g0038 [Nosema bombycis CQ1]